MNDDLNRFHSLCFLYACGKLDAEETAWMETMLLSHPALREELEADQRLVDLGRAMLADERQSARPLVSFEAVLRAMEKDEIRTPPAWLCWLRELWNQPLQTGWAAIAATLLIAISLVQTYRLDSTQQQIDQSSGYRGPSAPPALPTPLLKVIFADTASIADLRRLLPELNLTIVGGPDEQGTCLLAVGTGSAAQAKEKLQAGRLVLDVQVLREVP